MDNSGSARSLSTEAISSPSAPAAVGPYSAGIRTSGCGLIFVSGQLPLDPSSGEMVKGDPAALATRALANGLAIVEAAGSALRHIVKVTVFLTDLDNFEQVNKAYAEFFGEWRPARSVVEVTRLPRGSALEVEMIALQADLSGGQEST